MSPRPPEKPSAGPDRLARFEPGHASRWSEDRSSLHFASWIAGSVAYAALPERDDDSQTNLGVRGVDGELVTHPLDQNGALTLRLDGPRLELTFRDGPLREESIALIGRTVADVLGACSEILREHGLVREPIRLRPYSDFPDHPLGAGHPFPPGSVEARQVLLDAFAMADEAILRLGDREPGIAPARVWPHHFDLGALVTLEAGKQIGLGFSPGDPSLPRPYYYLAGYPSPDLSSAPELRHGSWNTDGFRGALRFAPDPDDPTAVEEIDAFLAEAFGVTRQLLTSDDRSFR